MASVKIAIPKINSGRKVTIKNSAGKSRTMTMAPPKFSYNSTAKIQEIARQGLKPITRVAGPSLAKIEFTQTVAAVDWQKSIESDVKWLRDCAARGYKVRFTGLSGLESGIWWHIKDLSINVTQRTPKNQPSRASVSWQLVEAVDVSVSAGKVTKTKSKPKKSKGSKPKAVTRTHKVKRGDTLGRIAQKYLGKQSRYPEIFKLNKKRIKNPNRLSVGWVLKIPKR